MKEDKDREEINKGIRALIEKWNFKWLQELQAEKIIIDIKALLKQERGKALKKERKRITKLLNRENFLRPNDKRTYTEFLNIVFNDSEIESKDKRGGKG